MTETTPTIARRIPARSYVPTDREVALGAEATGPVTAFRVDDGSDAQRASWRERIAEQRRSLDYRRITSRYGLRPLLLVAGVRIFGSLDNHTLAVVLPQMKEEFGVDLAFLLALGTVFGILTKLLAPLLGWMVDRVHRVRMLAVGSLLSNVGTMANGLAQSPAHLAGTQSVSGLGTSVLEPTSYPLLSDWYPVEARARVFSILGIAGSVSMIVGPLIGGGAAEVFGWRSAVIVFGVVGVVLSLLLFTLPEPTRGYYDRLHAGLDEDAADHEQPTMTWNEAWRAAGSIVTVRRIWYATPFLTVSGVGMVTMMPLYLAEEFGLGPFAIGAILAAGAVTGIVGLLIGAPMADRLIGQQPSRVMVLFGLVVALGVLPVLVLITSPWLAPVLAFSLPIGVFGAAIGPALATLLSLVIPARLRGLGLQTFAPWEILGLLMLPLVGIMGQQWGLRGAFFALIPVYLIGAAIIASTAGGVGRDIRASEAANRAEEESRRAKAEGRTKLIVCRDVDVAYDGTQVLFNVDFDVTDGEMIALVGTNGAGKSTLLRAIAGVQEASNGAIFLDGRDITHRPPTENARDGVVLVPGGRAIFPSLTVRENLQAALYLNVDGGDPVADVLELFPTLVERLDEAAGDLSGGEQQMVGLAQAFIMKPRLLMIDELSLGLAPAVVQRLLEVVRAINTAGTTVILVEQSINVALTVARRAVFMDKGQIRFDGPTEDLLGRSDLVRAVFLAGAGGGGITRRRDTARRSAAERERVLDVAGISVSYGGVAAVSDVSLTVDAGEVVGIIGPNGAGKTTLLDAVSGFVRPTSGTVAIAGVDVTLASPDVRARDGLARSFQNARLFGSLTVRDTIAVALETHLETRSAAAAALWLPHVARSERKVARRVARLIEAFGLEAFADKFVSELSTGSRRIVDLACIMATEPKVLLLDEPSSGLAQAESEALAPVVRRLARDAGCGIVVIEHDIPLVTSLSDRLVAMELGRVVLDGRPTDVVSHPRVIEAYLGTDDAVVDRSGPITAALAAAGIVPDADPSSATNKEYADG